jgi:hypothetical protein
MIKSENSSEHNKKSSTPIGLIIVVIVAVAAAALTAMLALSVLMSLTQEASAATPCYGPCGCTPQPCYGPGGCTPQGGGGFTFHPE